MSRIKILFLFLILLNLKFIISQEDSDLTLEDEPINNVNLSTDASLHKQQKKNIQEDSDEFDIPILLDDNIPRSHPQAKHPNSKHKQSPQVDTGSQTPMNLAYYEIFMIVFVAAFLLNCFLGKKTNENLAERWYRANKVFFEDNYAHLGAGTEYNPQTFTPILKESYNTYKFYASGRVFTKWMLVNMEFKKRHDLISILSNLFLYNEKDKIIYETSLAPSDDLPIVFCLCKKKDVRMMKKNYSDINFLCESTNEGLISEPLVLLSEYADLFDEFMFSNKTFVNAYKKIENAIDIIYFTDRQTYSKEPYAIFFSFDLNTNRGDLEELFKNITIFVHIVVDLLCSVKVTANYKREAERKRMEYEKIRTKELAQKTPEESKPNKSEPKSNKPLTREQAQKLDEKEKKESIKNQRKKMMKVVKK